MKKFQLTLVAVLMSLTAVCGQELTERLSASFSCKAKYASGKNQYLLDTCKVDCNYRLIMGTPAYEANVVWSRKNDFVFNKTKISFDQLSQYQDLKKKYDLITPVNAKFKFTVMFYSEKAKAYIASAKSEVEVPYFEVAGETYSLNTVVNKTWKELFTDVVVGKQDIKKPGVVISDKTLDEFYKMEKLEVGPLDNEVRGFGFRLARIYRHTTRMDIINVEMSVDWDDADYDYIVSEVSKKKEAAMYMAKKDTAKAVDAYYGNRKYVPSVSQNNGDFWLTTITPYEIWMNRLDEAEALYKKGKFDEAYVLYGKALDADSTLNYAGRKIKKIDAYKAYKAKRNVGSIELVFVEGNSDVESFYISKTEITQAQWARVMGRHANFKGCWKCPVENVSWEDAQAFIKKLSEQTGVKYRLPKEVEWEYAAEGGKKNVPSQFSGSNNIDEVSWCAYNSEETTHTVETKAPNELGLYDMSGNVAEWVADIYDKSTRIAKGGSWADDVTYITIKSREKLDVNHKSGRVGFRVCQDE